VGGRLSEELEFAARLRARAGRGIGLGLGVAVAAPAASSARARGNVCRLAAVRECRWAFTVRAASAARPGLVGCAAVSAWQARPSVRRKAGMTRPPPSVLFLGCSFDPTRKPFSQMKSNNSLTEPI